MPLCADSIWMRIDDEVNTDGDNTAPLRARMVRAHGGGMIVGRIINDVPNSEYVAQKWRHGRFVEVGRSPNFDSALMIIEAANY